MSIDYSNKVILRGKERFLVDPQEENDNEIGSVKFVLYKTKYEMDKSLEDEAVMDIKKRKLWDEEYRKNREIEKRELELEKEQEKEKAEERRKKAEREEKEKLALLFGVTTSNFMEWEKFQDRQNMKYKNNNPL